MAKKKTPTKSARPAKKAPPPPVKTTKKPTKTSAKPAIKPVVKPAAPVRQRPVLMVRPSLVKPLMDADGPVDTTKIKSPFSRKELNEYRKLLLEKRNEILGDMSSMSEEALRKNDSANLSHMPLHMADVGSDNYEQELTLGLVESERRILQEINEALQRINDGYFGVCQVTGKPITKARLQATPWAKYSIEAARMMERGRRF